MTQLARLLIVDDDRITLRNLEQTMKKEGYEVITTVSSGNALGLLEKNCFDLVIIDDRPTGKIDGLQVLRKCRERWPETEVILVSSFPNVESAVESMQQGAYSYIPKPYCLEKMRKVIMEALQKGQLKRNNQKLRKQIADQQEQQRVVTQDSRMGSLLEMAAQIAPTDCNVLVMGESGTGKELFARYLHEHSKRASGPYLAINCGAFNEELLANELFGHIKGAFTGAHQDKIGLIASAGGGTLFLDEITDMSPAMQVKLLRVIQEREVLPLGANKPVKTDVRLIAATNRDIHQEVKTNTFRQDLYFRLNVVTLQIPPLSARRKDIPLLAYFFLERFAQQMERSVKEISSDALELLKSYNYPGNVRELEHIIERAVALCLGEVLGIGHLPDELREQSIRTFRKKEGRIPSLEEQEQDYIRWVLEETNGNQTLAAQLLGIDRVSLWRKLKKIHL